MRLKEMFHKDIERDIKGVIKIGQDDEEQVYQELEEYVVTRELSKHFSVFFEAYKKSINDYTDKMGVWISGFFGSGKSHLLKILSYLLENREVKGKRAVDFFDDKIKDSLVLADIKRSGSINSDVILFNIDSKADSDSKHNKESILRVFNKVFNERMGFCGSLPWVAELERKLAKEKNYESFKERFHELSGAAWEEAREDYYFEEENIVTALADTTNMTEESARRWYTAAEDNYSLSIEDFANRVKEYIEQKEKEHHVIFMVDELGQYIGNDTQMMLNMQTIVEDLGTYCGGKAWVIVTSQQDIDTVTQVKGNDFSKIQGRFNTRLSLSSANVDEVIKKRLLRKTEVAQDTLKLLYGNKEAILKNLITFSSDTQDMRTFTTPESFVEFYPFIPYQFKLLQYVFTQIRQHGASGKHLAEGERSLLSAFQEAAQKYINSENGVLVPFSAFYDTIETFLDHNIRTVFMFAEENQQLNEKDIEVLKVLFMIKWVDEMPANIENISTLLIQDIDDDKVQIKKDVESSLGRLRKQSLIQKNGEEYIFLTNEEQDVNREIQHIEVEPKEIVQKIGEEIFNNIYSDTKFKYSKRYNFDFYKMIDETIVSTHRGQVGVQVITPYFGTGTGINDQKLKMMSSGENILIVNLPSDTEVFDEMEIILKIEKYLRRKGKQSGSEVIDEIRSRKSSEARQRKERVKDLLVEALKRADLFVKAQRLVLGEKDPVGRINSGLKQLVEGVYTKLNYITKHVDSQRDLEEILRKKEPIKLVQGVDSTPNKLALEEVIDFIYMSSYKNISLTMKTAIDHFNQAPYGWLTDDIRGIIAQLFKAQEIKLQIGGDYLDISDRNLIDYLTKKNYIQRLVIKRREKTPEKYLKKAKELFKELFDQNFIGDDEDSLMKSFKEYSEEELRTINEILPKYQNQRYPYPGKEILEKGKIRFEGILKIKDTASFFEKLFEESEVLFEYADGVRDVKSFFENQKEFFDKAVKQLETYENNEAYVSDLNAKEIIREIERIVKDDTPYSEIPKLPALVEKFITVYIEELKKECDPIKEKIRKDWEKVKDELAKNNLEDKLFDEFNEVFNDLLDRIDTTDNFYKAIAMKDESERKKKRCFEKIEEIKSPKPEPGEEVVDPPAPPKVGFVSISSIVDGERRIENKQDIEEILKEIRERLEKELQNNNELRLI